MKRLHLFMLAAILTVTFAACDQENVNESNTLYETNTQGIDKDDVVPPGERD